MSLHTIGLIAAAWVGVALVLAPLVGEVLRRTRLAQTRREAVRQHTAYPHFLPGERLP